MIHKLKNKQLIILLKKNYSRQKYKTEKKKFDGFENCLTDKVGLQKEKEIGSNNSIPQLKIKQEMPSVLGGGERQNGESPKTTDLKTTKSNEVCLEIFNAHMAINKTKMTIDEVEKVCSSDHKNTRKRQYCLATQVTVD